MFRSSIRAGTVLFVLLQVACGSSVIREPVVTLESVQLAGLGLRGGTLMVNVAIQNPNPFSLNANAVRYALSIAESGSPVDTTWLDVANGVYDEDFSVGGGRTESVQVPVEFTYAGLGSAASSILRAGTFTYRASGVVDVRTPLGTREVPFERDGIVTLLGAR